MGTGHPYTNYAVPVLGPHGLYAQAGRILMTNVSSPRGSAVSNPDRLNVLASLESKLVALGEGAEHRASTCSAYSR